MACMTVFSWYPYQVQVFHISTRSFSELSAPQPINQGCPNPPERFGTFTRVNLNGMHILFCAQTGGTETPATHLHSLLIRECHYHIKYPSTNSLSGAYVVYPGKKEELFSRAYLFPVGTRFLFSQRPGLTTQVTFPFIQLKGRPENLVWYEDIGNPIPTPTKPFVVQL